ncbi:MAG: T9SS type A sorting domain-containing protein [Bacteroidota bacterium]
MNILLRSTLALFLFFSVWFVSAQDTIKIMHYNLLFYGFYTDFCTVQNNNVEEKNQNLETILQYYQPDIFTVNELGQGEENLTLLKDHALNTQGVNYYEHADYTNSNNGWFANGFFYDSRKFGLLDQVVVSTLVRDINLYKLYFKSEDLQQTQDTTFLHCIVAHLKAGSSTSDQQARSSMINNVMNYLTTFNISENVVFMGDFNMRSSYEDAFQKLVNYPDYDFRFHDPVEAIGVWNNNENMSAFHTQSTRSSNHSCFVGGGLDDRFDFILVDSDIWEGHSGLTYVENSYYAPGQDGERYNQSLISPANQSEPQNIISALYNTSDHLPVILELTTTHNTFTENVPRSIVTPQLSVSNPVTDKFSISFTSDVTGEIKIILHSLEGKRVFSGSVIQDDNTFEHKLDVASLERGFYVLTVILPTGRHFSSKIVKF